jgi:secreted PhoX family phosphatase
MERREFLRKVFFSAGALAAPSWIVGCGESAGAPAPGRLGASRFASLGPLQAADANGLMLPAGFTSRVVAVSGQVPVLGGTYVWHTFPDGGATYATPDGGWVYTSNSEVPGSPLVSGGCGALKFDAQGDVVDAYSILSGTRSNCAGGKTPWHTWMSCEETADGLVYDCDPLVPGEGAACPKLGMFNREAVAVDPLRKVLYMTEDAGSGRLYRFVPSASDWPAGAARPALEDGVLQVLRYAALDPDQAPPEGFALEQAQPIVWDDVVAPDQPQGTVRSAEAAAGRAPPGTPFDGGEGLWHREGIVYFSTKGDNRIWALDIAAQTLEVLYDFATASEPNRILSGVDNLTVTEHGDVLVAEDGGDMDLCVLMPDRNLVRLLKASDLSGASELTGPAFSPDGTRLYFSAQRNGRNGALGNGITFEVTLPFAACPTREC